MKIKLIVVGNIKEKYYRNIIEDQIKRLKKRSEFTIVELKDDSIPKNAGAMEEQRVKNAEGKRILEQISNSDYVYALCIDGKMLKLEELKKHMYNQSQKIAGNLVFVIGGSLGLSDEVVARANYRLSFSNMTFPHQLMRLMLLEQLERIVYL